MEKQAFEQTGLIPRSIIRTFDRFRKQLLPGAETLIIQEFRISRYQVLVSVKCLISLIIIPFLVNFLLKFFCLMPLTEYFWNTYQDDIFLNSYQQNRAFIEMQNFEDKIYFDFLINENYSQSASLDSLNFSSEIPLISKDFNFNFQTKVFDNNVSLVKKYNKNSSFVEGKLDSQKFMTHERKNNLTLDTNVENFPFTRTKVSSLSDDTFSQIKRHAFLWTVYEFPFDQRLDSNQTKNYKLLKQFDKICQLSPQEADLNNLFFLYDSHQFLVEDSNRVFVREEKNLNSNQSFKNLFSRTKNSISTGSHQVIIVFQEKKQEEKMIQQKFQEKTLQLALFYNQQSIEALTNLVGDFLTFGTVSFLAIWMKPQIIILKSFLTESIYSLSDTTKSFLLILVTDLLVGFHSPHGWEIFLETVLRHFGLPESQEFVFLFVATFPVLLDTVFKYWIFRYLNQISPSTVATYHSMIE